MKALRTATTTAALLAATATAPAATADTRDDLSAFCQHLGNVAVKLAENRDQGAAKAQSLSTLYAAMSEDGIDPDGAYGQSLKAVLDVVYAYPRREPGNEGVGVYTACMSSDADKVGA